MSKKRNRARELKKIISTETKTDRSAVVHQDDKIKVPLNIFDRPLSGNHKKFVDLAISRDTKMIIAIGPAGTAKTYLAVYVSLLLMNQKKVSDLIYVRSVVESSDVKMGFLPGEKNDKMSPYIQPLVDKLDELLPVHDIKKLQAEKRIEALPVGYLRGLNWNAKAIIGDEMQNCTRKELITLMTRVGEFSKLFLIGDPSQADINGKTGLKELYKLFSDDESKANGIYTFEFTEEDIVRSRLVQFITKKVKNTG
jgi:phosphate starvation-inducible PhoH-like protein